MFIIASFISSSPEIIYMSNKMLIPLQIMEHQQIRSYVAKLDVQHMETFITNVKGSGQNTNSN